MSYARYCKFKEEAVKGGCWIIKRFRILLVLITIGMVFVTACTLNKTKVTPVLEDTIRIGYFSEDNFKTRYSSLINNDTGLAKARYTIIPTSELIKGKTDTASWIEENEFDLIYLPGPLMEQFVENDKLKKLDTVIVASGLDLDSFVPAAMELSKLYGQGEMYGLPPSIDGQAIVYNKSLFEIHKVNLPKDNMHWFDLIDLAESFPSTGLTIPNENGFEWIWDIGHIDNNKAYRNNPPMVTFNSDAWYTIWEHTREPLSNGTIVTNEYFIESFLKGEAAMSLVTARQYSKLQQKRPDFDWGMVTMPVSSSHMDVTKYMHADGFYAISASSPNQEAAFKWLQFLLSEKTLKSDEMMGHYGIAVRKKNVLDPFAEALFKLHPVKRDVLPFEYLELGKATLQTLISSSISTNDALDEFQEKAEVILRNTR